MYTRAIIQRSFSFGVRGLWGTRLIAGESSQDCSTIVQGKTRVGIALCGFGRAGNIHFKGVIQNHRCSLKYVVERAEILESVQEYLDKYNLSDTARPITTEDFENVTLSIY